MSEPDIGFGLVQLQPTASLRQIYCLVFGWAPAFLVEKWRIDLLDVDAPVLDGLHAVGDLQDFTGSPTTNFTSRLPC